MLISGTFTKAVMYLMLLSDSIIAGFFIGEAGVAGINAITPVTAIVTFFGDLVSTGVGIVFAQEVGATGAALVVAAGIKGEDVLELSRRLVKSNCAYVPNPENKEVYERNFRVFKNLYKSNAANFKGINA